MSNLNNRLSNIERTIEMNKGLFPEMPDFSKVSDGQLDSYIIGWINNFNFTNKITSYGRAEEILKQELEIDLRDCKTEDEKNKILSENGILLKVLREYWKQGNKPENKDKPVFFIS